MEQAKQEQKERFTKHSFFFELPLYTVVNLEDLEEDFYKLTQGDVDAHSPEGFDTTYNISRWYLGKADPTYNNYWALSLACKRKGSTLEFFVYKTEKTIVKVGQFLSLADLQYAEIDKKYDKVLSTKDLHDLKKAIGLMAHGAGAGSLVYLRRIFENIIKDTYEEHKSSIGVAETDFYKKRMDEKVQVLKDFLPSQLIEMKSVYGILSKGVHELGEKDCLTYFPALKLSITLILDQKIEEAKKQEKDAAVKKQLQLIQQEISIEKNNEK